MATTSENEGRAFMNDALWDRYTDVARADSEFSEFVENEVDEAEFTEAAVAELRKLVGESFAAGRALAAELAED